jgi:hypothetical protein
LIAWLCEDELVQGRKWFMLLIALSLVGLILFYILEMPIITLTFTFILTVSLVSLIQSYSEKVSGTDIIHK